MSTRFLRHRSDGRGVGLGCPGLPAARPVGDRAPPNFVPFSTPSFTSCGLAASGARCHAEFHRLARSTITFKRQNSGAWVHLHRVLYEQARRDAGRAACPSVATMDGQSSQDDRAWWCSWFRRAQARKRVFFSDLTREPLQYLIRSHFLISFVAIHFVYLC